MKATIRDLGTYRAVRPLDLTSYLRTRGWQPYATGGGPRSVWEGGPDNGYEVLVPLDPETVDHGRRVADAFRLIALAEDRAQIEVYRDVVTASFDIVRIRAIDSDFEDGTVPVDAGVAIVERSRDLLLAAACAAHQARSVFYARKPVAAVEYLRRVRLGQTEHGSFVVALHAPVPPELQVMVSGIESPEPYERKVTATLLGAVGAAREAALAATTSGGVRPFEDAVRHGVSANLCDALVGLHAFAACEAITIGVSWAATRSVSPALRTTAVTIRRDALPVLEEASRLLKQKHPDKRVEVTGYVIALKRDEGELFGTATVVGVTPAGPRRIQLVDLGTEDYDIVLDAHRREHAIGVAGELRKEGRLWILRGAESLEVLDAEQDPE